MGVYEVRWETVGAHKMITQPEGKPASFYHPRNRTTDHHSHETSGELKSSLMGDCRALRVSGYVERCL